MTAQKPQPPLLPPVRAVMPDGDVIPLEFICHGFVSGAWRWAAAWPLRAAPAQLAHDPLPDKVTIALWIHR